MNILILGGTGFLGRNIVNKLSRFSGINLIIVGRHENAYEKIHNVRFIKNDILEIDFESILSDVDCVLHMVSASVPSIQEPILDLEKTIIPTIELLNACVKNKVNKIIFFSSGGTVYGIPNKVPIREDYLTNPISAYGVHKITIEKYLRYYHYMYGLQTISLRISNPYGPFQRAFSNQGFIANALGNYLTNKSINIWGDGSIVRDYIYVDDVVSAVERCIYYDGEQIEFNIGYGVGYSLNDIIAYMSKIFKKQVHVNYLSGHAQDVPINVLDICRAKKELDWQPKIMLDEGIMKMVKCWDSTKKTFSKI